MRGSTEDTLRERATAEEMRDGKRRGGSQRGRRPGSSRSEHQRVRPSHREAQSRFVESYKRTESIAKSRLSNQRCWDPFLGVDPLLRGRHPKALNASCEYNKSLN